MQNIYQQITSLMEDFNYTEALKTCENALSEYPDDMVLNNLYTGLKSTVDVLEKENIVLEKRNTGDKLSPSLNTENEYNPIETPEIIEANSNELLIKEMFGETFEFEATENKETNFELLATKFKEAAHNNNSTELYGISKKYHELGTQVICEDYDFLGVVYESEVQGKITYFGVYMDKIIYIDANNNQLVVRFENNVIPNFMADFYNKIYKESAKIICELETKWQEREEDIPKDNCRFTFLTIYGSVVGSGTKKQMLDKNVSIAGELGDCLSELLDLVIKFSSGQLSDNSVEVKKLVYTTQSGAKREDVLFVVNRFCNRLNSSSCFTSDEDFSNNIKKHHQENIQDIEKDDEQNDYADELYEENGLEYYKYQKLANNLTKENYSNILDSTIDIIKYKEEYSELTKKFLDIREYIIKQDSLKNSHDVNAKYAINDINLDEYEKRDWEKGSPSQVLNGYDPKYEFEKQNNLKNRISDIFAGAFLYNVLPKDKYDTVNTKSILLEYAFIILDDFCNLNELRAALFVANLLIDYDSQYDELHVKRAHIYNDMGEWQKAVDDCTYAIRLNPEHYNAYYGRAINNISLENYHDAIRDLTIVLQEFPTHINAYGYRAQAKSAIGDIEGAISDFQIVLKFDPENESAKISIKNLNSIELSGDISNKLAEIKHIDSNNVNTFKELANKAIEAPNAFELSVLNAFIEKARYADKNLNEDDKKDIATIISKLAIIILNMGNDYYYKDNYEKAKKCYDMVIKVKQNIDDTEKLIEAYLRCAEISVKNSQKIQIGMLKSAIDIFPESETIREFITNNYDFFTYQNFIDTGIKYYNKGIFEYAIEIFTNAESVAVKEYEKNTANNWIKNAQQKMS